MNSELNKYLEEIGALYVLPDSKGLWRHEDYKQLSFDLKNLLNERWGLEDGISIHWSVFTSDSGGKKHQPKKIEEAIAALKILLENANLVREKLLTEYRSESSERKQNRILEKLTTFWIRKMEKFDYYSGTKPAILTNREKKEVIELSDLLEKKYNKFNLSMLRLNLHFGRLLEASDDPEHFKFTIRAASQGVPKELKHSAEYRLLCHAMAYLHIRGKTPDSGYTLAETLISAEMAGKKILSLLEFEKIITISHRFL